MIGYGPTKVGKTSMFAHFPRCGFIIDSQEQGINYLVNRHLVPTPQFIWQIPNDPTGWEKLINQIIRASAEAIDTLVVESLTGIEGVCFMHHAKKHFAAPGYPDGDISNADNSFYSYQKGPKQAAKFEMPGLLESLNTVLDSGKNVIIAAHSFEKETTTSEGVKHLKHIPVAEAQVWVKLARWASVIAFFGYKIEADSEKNRGALKKVAKPSMDRLIYIEPTPYCEAGNWWGMQGVIDMGDSGREAYDHFMERLMG